MQGLAGLDDRPIVTSTSLGPLPYTTKGSEKRYRCPKVVSMNFTRADAGALQNVSLGLKIILLIV